jgi:hypothetical protein
MRVGPTPTKVGIGLTIIGPKNRLSQLRLDLSYCNIRKPTYHSPPFGENGKSSVIPFQKLANIELVVVETNVGLI